MLPAIAIVAAAAAYYVGYRFGRKRGVQLGKHEVLTNRRNIAEWGQSRRQSGELQ